MVNQAIIGFTGQLWILLGHYVSAIMGCASQITYGHKRKNTSTVNKIIIDIFIFDMIRTMLGETSNLTRSQSAWIHTIGEILTIILLQLGRYLCSYFMHEIWSDSDFCLLML